MGQARRRAKQLGNIFRNPSPLVVDWATSEQERELGKIMPAPDTVKLSLARDGVTVLALARPLLEGVPSGQRQFNSEVLLFPDKDRKIRIMEGRARGADHLAINEFLMKHAQWTLISEGTPDETVLIYFGPPDKAPPLDNARTLGAAKFSPMVTDDE